MKRIIDRHLREWKEAVTRKVFFSLLQISLKSLFHLKKAVAAAFFDRDFCETFISIQDKKGL